MKKVSNREAGWGVASALAGMATALGLVLASTVPGTASGATAGGNVPNWVLSARSVGDARDSERVRIALFLSFRDIDGLKSLVAAVSTPGSAQYRQYLTPDEFRARFAPDPAQVKLVQETLKSLGFKIESTPKSGIFVEASGTVAQVKAAFGVTQKLYSVQGKTLRANAEMPKLPARIAGIVTYVGGLDESPALLKPAYVTRDRGETLGSAAGSPNATADAKIIGNAPPPPQTGIIGNFCSTYWGDHTATLSTTPGFYPATVPWELCGYTPQQLRQAYGADKVTQTGKGVKVGIVDLYASPTIVFDANQYSKNHGLPALTYLNFQQIVPPGLFSVPASDPCGPQGWYAEESLDVEAVHSMAPDAYIVFTGITCTDPGNTGLYNLIDNHIVDIITNSYGFNGEALSPDFINTENAYFLQAAAEGISVLFSSGDDGDNAAGNGIASGSWEATSPYVTAVGGTSLALYDSTGKKAEWGWGDYRAFLNGVTVSTDGTSITTSGLALPFAFYSGSGGGPSLSQLAPDYQANVPYLYSGYTKLANGNYVWLQTPHRVTPDISLVGDPYTGFIYGETFAVTGDPVYDAPCTPIGTTGNEYCETVIGGTSLASPLGAGVVALLDQAAEESGHSTFGFLNPFIYSLPVGPAGSSTAPLIDVAAPRTPTAVLRGYLGNPNKVRLVTMNSAPNVAGTAVTEGLDTSYRTVRGYDETTGNGTPNVPALIQLITGATK
jgi:subtilase family serine protease